MERISFPDKVARAVNFVYAIRLPDVRAEFGVDVPGYFSINSFIPMEVSWGDTKQVVWDGENIPGKFTIILSDKSRQVEVRTDYDGAGFRVVAVRFTKEDNPCAFRSTAFLQLSKPF